MSEWIYINIEHVLCGLILLGRVGDIVSTRLITPKLKLEANLLAKKLGWPFGILTLLVCLLPYYSLPAGIVVLVPSLMVSSSNIAKIWVVRAYGEDEFMQRQLQLAARSK